VQNKLFALSLLVKDYDEAIQYYTEVLQFSLLENTDMGKGKRWVVVTPSKTEGCKLLLAKAKNDAELKAVGNQTGGRVFLFLHTSEFDTYYKHLSKHEVEFCESPRHEPYGKVVVFKDLYGNKWDLIEPV
jgi:lactoylglutathione lyase